MSKKARKKRIAKCASNRLLSKAEESVLCGWVMLEMYHFFINQRYNIVILTSLGTVKEKRVRKDTKRASYWMKEMK